MIAGIPGAGINGVYCLLLTAVMPVRCLWRTITGRAVHGQWPRIVPLVSMAVGMFLVLVGEFWMLELIGDLLVKHGSAFFGGHAGKIAQALAGVAPAFKYMPFVLLACLVSGIHLLRFA